MTGTMEQPRPGAAPDGEGAGAADAKRARASRQWRSLWRIHFYSGLFSMPFLLLMALTGLVILYTQPIQDATQSDLWTVEARTLPYVSLDRQEAAVERAHPDDTVTSVTPPAARDRSTQFFVDDGSKDGLYVFVDPYTGRVLGDTGTAGGIVGLANRLHGYLNNDTVKVSLPTVSALWDDGAVMRPYEVGDLLLEILGVWTLVLVASGVYLFWPRHSRYSEGTKGRRRLLTWRRGVTGRARWRDLHGLGGLLMVVVLVLTIVSGMGWSTYWGPSFNSLAAELTPGDLVEPPSSELGVRGDLDRLGNHIPWATGDFPIPASYAPKRENGSNPAPMRLDQVATIAVREGMKPGYTISFPANERDGKETVYGSFALANSWPRRTSEARDVFLDQFTGATLARQSVYGNGAIATGMDTLVSVHMGTQLGLADRIAMTLVCVLTVWAIVSGFVMFWKRRRRGTSGFPRRPADPRLTTKLVVAAVVLGVIYPEWGVSALIVLGLDRFVIRRVPRLRSLFGQP